MLKITGKAAGSWLRCAETGAQDSACGPEIVSAEEERITGVCGTNASVRPSGDVVAGDSFIAS